MAPSSGLAIKRAAVQCSQQADGAQHADRAGGGRKREHHPGARRRPAQQPQPRAAAARQRRQHGRQHLKQHDARFLPRQQHHDQQRQAEAEACQHDDVVVERHERRGKCIGLARYRRLETGQ
jgi:hypothetical protein